MDAIIKTLLAQITQRGNRERDRREEWERSLKPTQYKGNNLFQEMGGNPIAGRYLGQVGLIPGQFVPNIGRNPNKPVIPGLPIPVETIEEEPIFIPTDSGFPDYIVVEYVAGANSSDLDTRFQMLEPAVSPYLGYLGNNPFGAITFGSPTFLEWGMDNVGQQGVEAILFRKSKYLQNYTSSNIQFDVRAYYYSALATNHSVFTVKGYFGGNMVKGTGSRQFTWDNPTATSNIDYGSKSFFITLLTTSVTIGQSMGILTFDMLEGKVIIN